LAYSVPMSSASSALPVLTAGTRRSSRRKKVKAWLPS